MSSNRRGIIPSTFSDEAHEGAFHPEDYEESLPEDYRSFEEDDVNSEESIEQANYDHFNATFVENPYKLPKRTSNLETI
ncbi:hypothetical protein NHQ30_005893 [Ciborinia camelliae]|nr:hypothetical protein NHQ30_005893 [Ciborinia camelliae]